MLRLIVFASLLWPGAAWSRDWVASKGPLSDTQFYRLVACRAAPGAGCRERFQRWTPGQARALTVALYRTGKDYPPATRRKIDAALDAAVAHINGAGSGLLLRRTADGQDADIRVFLLGNRADEPIRGTFMTPLDGRIAGGAGAMVQVWRNRDHDITKAAIILSRDVNPSKVKSLVLEELFQSLGFLTDIRNPWYETRSIVSEDSNSFTRLGEQDQMALRRHYPPRN